MARPMRTLYVTLTIGFALLYATCFVGRTDLSALPPGFPPTGTTYPAVFDGIEAGSAEDVRFRAERLPPGSALRVEDAAGLVYEAHTVRAFSLSYLASVLLSGTCFLAVAAFVFAPRAATPGVPLFWWISILYGLSVMQGGIHFARPHEWLVMARSSVMIAGPAVLPVLFVHLVLTFPRRRFGSALVRAAVPALWALAVGLVVWQAASYWRYFAGPGPEVAEGLLRPRRVAGLVLISEFAVGLVVLFRSAAHLELTRERHQTKWLLWGFAVGASPYVLGRTLPRLFGFDPFFPQQFDRLLELAIPAAFGLAVVRYRFLDIDIIIRRSLLYGLLASGVLVVYLSLSLLVGRSLGVQLSGGLTAALIATGILAGALFAPLRDQLGTWVDRVFFKIRYDHARALVALHDDLNRVSDLGVWAEHVSRFLARHFRPSTHAVILRDRGRWYLAGDLPEAAARIAFESTRGSVGPGGRWVAPDSTSLPEIEDDGFPDDLVRAGIVLAVPFRSEGPVEAAWMLAPKVTERRWVETDIALLEDAARAAHDALERIVLARTVVEESTARLRLDELDRAKNDFLSRVAHDVRTPIASIAWSTDNLLDGLVGDLNERQSEYLRSIKTSTIYLNRLVSNLLEISKLEGAHERVGLEPVALGPVLEQAIETMRPLGRIKDVRIDLRLDPGGALVRANAEKVLEVVVNLIDNALEYAPSGSVIEVAATALGDGSREVSVRDRGPGVGDVDPDVLFERFAQSERSPHSQKHGFGLGLYIVRSYMDLMEGSVSVVDHPEGGAVFTCRFAGGDHE